MGDVVWGAIFLAYIAGAGLWVIGEQNAHHLREENARKHGLPPPPSKVTRLGALWAVGLVLLLGAWAI